MILFARLRWILVALLLALGVIFHVRLGLADAWYFYLVALILVLTHLFFGNVWQAFQALRKGQITVAEKLLAGVWSPNWLLPQQRAYFYFSRGLLAFHHKQVAIGQADLEQALGIGLRTANDRALAHLNLAHAAVFRKDRNAAQAAIAAGEAEQPTDILLKDQLVDLAKRLKQ